MGNVLVCFAYSMLGLIPSDTECMHAMEDVPSPEPTGWALEETFAGDPSSPSQDLLPRNFDFTATHRTHPQEVFTKNWEPYLADHDGACNGPDPSVDPLPQHFVTTSQSSTGSRPDGSFYVCKDHMMSSMGEVDPYSVSAFWAKQDFDFSAGGTLEFDVNINDGHTVRSWWEVMITPRDQLRVGAGPIDSPISETYPLDRIVFDFRRSVRTIKIGTGAYDPEGWIVNETPFGPYDYQWWSSLHPDDPALTDHRIRRKMIIRIAENEISWKIETATGEFDEYKQAIPSLPFTKGLVVFKTHAYTPSKDGNTNIFTFHWDNIRFSGPVTGLYDVYEANDVVYLEANGSRAVGEQETVTIDLPSAAGFSNPLLFGQVHHPVIGQVLVSINGGPNQEIAFTGDYEENNCYSQDWRSFQLPLDPSTLQGGINTLTWTIGPRPSCLDGTSTEPSGWNGFSVKFLQIQLEK